MNGTPKPPTGELRLALIRDQGIVLSPSDVARIAKVAETVKARLDAASTDSLFDTEPSHYARLVNLFGQETPR